MFVLSAGSLDYHLMLSPGKSIEECGIIDSGVGHMGTSAGSALGIMELELYMNGASAIYHVFYTALLNSTLNCTLEKLVFTTLQYIIYHNIPRNHFWPNFKMLLPSLLLTVFTVAFFGSALPLTVPLGSTGLENQQRWSNNYCWWPVHELDPSHVASICMFNKKRG